MGKRWVVSDGTMLVSASVRSAEDCFAIWLPLNASIGEMDSVGDRPARCVPVTTTSCRVVVDLAFAAGLLPCAAVAWLAWACPLSDAPASCACTEHATRSEEHTSELQSRRDLVCRLLLEKKKRRRQGSAPTRPCPA